MIHRINTFGCDCSFCTGQSEPATGGSGLARKEFKIVLFIFRDVDSLAAAYIIFRILL